MRRASISASEVPRFGRKPNCAPITCVREAVYLGGLISCDGKELRELSRRLGEGRAIFDSLAKVWSHTNITITRKIKLYISCVANKILYSLDSLWLLQAERRRLDAFHFRCLRKLLRIPCSYISRVPNMEVLRQSGLPPLSKLLERRQAQLYRRITDLPADSLVKQVVCTQDGEPIRWNLRRARGRPRQTWAKCVYQIACAGA